MEKDTQTVSLGASKLTWDIVTKDSKKHGFNTVSAYTQYLYEQSHHYLKKRPRELKLIKLAILLDTVLLFVLVIARI